MGMEKVKFLLGFLWCLPITLLAFLFYVGPFWAMGWYKLVGWRQLAWIFHLQDKAPGWLKKKWLHWAGQTTGNLIVMKQLPEESQYAKIILTHELTHTKQCMILGVFQPLCYGLQWICGTILKKTTGDVDGYYDNLFEIHARRSAGQIIDIVGLTKKLQESKKGS